MAKLVVEIDIPIPYEELQKEVIEQKGKSDWYSEEDGDKVMVDEAYLERSRCDDSFYTFKLIEVK